jgi:hypothetical protein
MDRGSHRSGPAGSAETWSNGHPGGSPPTIEVMANEDQAEHGERDEPAGFSGEKAASDIAQAVIGSPAFGQAVSAAVAAREFAGEAQRAAMGALNVSSQDQAERLERRIRVLSERLEETEDRLDEAINRMRVLEAAVAALGERPEDIRRPSDRDS